MTGSGGRHHYMIVPEGFLAMDSVADFPGIEFKGHGRQVVAPGSSHPNTGKPYVWIADEFAPSISEARMAPGVLIEPKRRPERASMTEAGAYRPDALAEMLTGLNAEDHREHDKWVGVMLASADATAGEGGSAERRVGRGVVSR